MIKRALPIVMAILGLCQAVWAQAPASFILARASTSAMVEGRTALGESGAFRSLNSAWAGRGPLTLIDGRSFSFPGAFGWVEATAGDFLPAFTAEELPRLTPATTTVESTPNEKLGLLRRPDYVGGEVGVFYGRSVGGKYSREVEQGYFTSEIVEGDTHIMVGGSYGRSSGKASRIIGR